MTKEEIIKIFEQDSAKDFEGDNAYQGLQIIPLRSYSVTCKIIFSKSKK